MISGKRIGQTLGLVALGFTLFIVSAGYGQSSTPTQGCTLDAGANQRPNEGVPTSYEIYLEPKGELKGVMIFVDFADAPQSESTEDLYNQLASPAAPWFAEVSYGRMSLNVTPVHKWYRMPHAWTSYRLNRATFATHREYISDAIKAADADVDFKQYNIIYIVSEKGADFRSALAFIAPEGQGVLADGVEIRHAATIPAIADFRDPHPNYWAAFLIHETGHLFGLPDIYNFTSTRIRPVVFVGSWDPMEDVPAGSPGAHFLAWHKWKLGWLEASQLLCLNSGQVEETITPLEVSGGVKSIAILTSRSTAYVIEVRQLIGQDSLLCDKGVLVYKVDATAQSGFMPIVVKPALTGDDPEQIEKCGLLYNAPFDLGPGEVSKFEVPAIELVIEVLSASDGAYKVRVSKQSD